MNLVTLVMPYYQNTNMLMEHYSLLASIEPKLREFISLVVVDDGSPDVSAPLPPAELSSMSVQVFRMLKDVRWNQDACRNIGVKFAETNWVLLTDIDHMVPLETWQAVLLRKLDEACVYRFARVSAPDMSQYKPHPNSWLMTRAMYDLVGGYDERFAGLYGTDGDFRDRVHECAKEVCHFKQALIRVPRWHIADASTITYLRKQPEDRTGLDRIRKQRDALPPAEQRPIRFTFPFKRVYP